MLQLNRSLHKDALKVFRTIQRIMGDREASDRPGVLRSQSSQQFMQQARSMMSDDVPVSPGPSALIEQQRSILALGITHGELRDEIYCQLMKQLCGNPST
jgi:Rho GTPase-activating protein 39